MVSESVYKLPYFHIRDELTAQNGIIFRGDRCIIPKALRPQILLCLHSAHLGIEGCLRRARKRVHWPGMNHKIRDYVEKCYTCRKYQTSNTRETLMSHEIPARPWQKVGTDLFSLKDKIFLVTVDYFSNFWEIDSLGQDTSAKTVIRKLKAHFTRYGCPETVVSDNGRQCASAEFATFSKEWDFEHTPSSPGNSRSNGQAESAVKTARKLLRKAIDTKSDVQLAILDHSNTPSQSHDMSPAQRLLNRRTRTLLPTAGSLLQPRADTSQQRKSIQLTKEEQAEYFNRSAKDLPPLCGGDKIRIKPFIKGNSEWQKGTALRSASPSSYTPTGCYRDVRTQGNSSPHTKTKTHCAATSEIPRLCVEVTTAQN